MDEEIEPQDEFLFSDEFTEADWHESITAGRLDTISRDRSACTLTIECEFAKYKAAVRKILGYSWVDENLKLRREVPVYHPVWGWLYARAITKIQFAGPTDTDQLQWEDAMPFGVYEWAQIEIEFGEVYYDVWKDSEVTYEWERYLTDVPGEHVELIQIDAGQMKAYAPGVTLINGNPFISAPRIQARVEKNKRIITWHEVPHEFLYDENGQAPKLKAIQKRVNSAPFWGSPAGTLLCESCEAKKKPMPIATDYFEGQRYHYDVEMVLIEFDPEPGDVSVDKRGWNLLPGPRASGAAGDSFVSWYYYTHDGTVTGKPLFDEYNFADFFTHHSL